MHGDRETDSACPGLAGLGVAALKLPGDHHFGRDYNTVAGTLLKEAGISK